MMRSETQQHGSCVKRDVELAPMQMLSRTSGAMYHASTSPLVLSAVVAHAPSARHSCRGLQSIRLVHTKDPHRDYQCFRTYNSVPSDVCLYKARHSARYVAKHSSTADIFLPTGTHVQA